MSLHMPENNELRALNFDAKTPLETKTSPLTDIPVSNIAAKELNQGPPNVLPKDMGERLKSFFTKAAGVGAIGIGGTVFVALFPLTVPLHFVGYTLGGLIGKKIAENKDNPTKDDIQDGKRLGIDIGSGIATFGTTALVLAGMHLLGIKRAPLWEPPSLNKPEHNDPTKELAKLEKQKTKLEQELKDMEKNFNKTKNNWNDGTINPTPNAYGQTLSKLGKLQDERKIKEQKLEELDKKIEELKNQVTEDTGPIPKSESEHSQTIHEDWKQPLEALKEFDASTFMTEEELESTTASSSTQPNQAVDLERLRPQLLALREIKNELETMKSSSLDKSSIKDFEEYFELRKEVMRNIIEYTKTGNADYNKAAIELAMGLREAGEKAMTAKRAFEQL